MKRNLQPNFNKRRNVSLVIFLVTPMRRYHHQHHHHDEIWWRFRLRRSRIWSYGKKGTKTTQIKKYFLLARIGAAHLSNSKKMLLMFMMRMMEIRNTCIVIGGVCRSYPLQIWYYTMIPSNYVHLSYPQNYFFLITCYLPKYWKNNMLEMIWNTFDSKVV